MKRSAHGPDGQAEQEGSTTAPDAQPPPGSRGDGGVRHNRRQLLRGGAMGVTLVGLGAALDTGVRALADSTAPGGPTPGETLMTEHGVLKRVLLAYTAAAVLPPSPQVWSAVRTCALVVRDYVEGFHETIEETYVFPELLSAGLQQTVLTTLLNQHGMGRRLTASLLSVTDPAGTGPTDAASVRTALTSFVRMYERHEAWEDTVVYPAHRALLGERKLALLGERIVDLERRQLGPSSLADALDRLAPAEAALGTDDVAAVTPTLGDEAR